VTPPDVPLKDYLRARRDLVDAALERFLPAPPGCPAVIAEPMRYSLFAGGKRLRPILALAAAETVGADPEEALALALPAACALELIHTYSLVHDDLPAMDDDTLRRGRPTSHVVYGEGMAILAGDGLLTEAFALLARSIPPSALHPPPPDLAERVRRTIALIGAAAGACGMVGGQAIDLQAVGTARLASIEALRDMHARKTGALIRASATTGAIMGGGTEEEIAAIQGYGASIGLAFQIVDDILDVEGASADLGKTAGKDAAAGKPTYPALLGLDASRRLAAETMDEALGALAPAGLRSSRLEEIARWVVERHS
jgi:geranylgeranyl diphosphate synthase type II